MHTFIDYSQYKTFIECEVKWLEKYFYQMQREPRVGQKDDARTLGSLVHEGLRTLRLTGKPEIPASATVQYMPTPEALAQANSLLLGYVRAYPGEQDLTDRYFCEEPLRFPLECGWQGLAKIDSYFRVAEHRVVPDGLGSTVALRPGWWIHEYKTKDTSRDLGNYIEGWRMNMQPSFQMMALGEQINEPVVGVLVNVLEKSKPYYPKRVCKGCKTQSEFRNWIPASGLGEGVYICPLCNHTQLLEAPEAKAIKPNSYYRLVVEKTPEELHSHRNEINAVAMRMQDLSNLAWPVRATERCVDSVWGKCEYFDPHSVGQWAKDMRGFVPVESLKYVNQ